MGVEGEMFFFLLSLSSLPVVFKLFVPRKRWWFEERSAAGIINYRLNQSQRLKWMAVIQVISARRCSCKIHITSLYFEENLAEQSGYYSLFWVTTGIPVINQCCTKHYLTRNKCTLLGGPVASHGVQSWTRYTVCKHSPYWCYQNEIYLYLCARINNSNSSVLSKPWWYELPAGVRTAESLSLHKRHKTHLFGVHLDCA